MSDGGPIGVGRPARRRRSPAESRRRLLDTAEGLVAEHGPDALTIREVARAAQVTAGLVTHYFGSREALIREVLHRQDALTGRRFRAALRRRGAVLDADGLLRLLFDALAEPRRVRLFVWAHLHGGRGRRTGTGLRALVDALAAGFGESLSAADRPPRARIEAVTLVALSAMHGWAVGRDDWVRSLGRGTAGREDDRRFLAALTLALRALMAGLAPPARR
jgi:AcrR family transcriptional regulator